MGMVALDGVLVLVPLPDNGANRKEVPTATMGCAFDRPLRHASLQLLLLLLPCKHCPLLLLLLVLVLQVVVVVVAALPPDATPGSQQPHSNLK
jgi:hypothetical protein